MEKYPDANPWDVPLSTTLIPRFFLVAFFKPGAEKETFHSLQICGMRDSPFPAIPIPRKTSPIQLGNLVFSSEDPFFSRIHGKFGLWSETPLMMKPPSLNPLEFLFLHEIPRKKGLIGPKIIREGGGDPGIALIQGKSSPERWSFSSSANFHPEKSHPTLLCSHKKLGERRQILQAGKGVEKWHHGAASPLFPFYFGIFNGEKSREKLGSGSEESRAGNSIPEISCSVPAIPKALG